MALKHEIESLRAFPMLADLPPWQLEVVAEAVEPVRTQRGKTILERGSDDGYTYFLTEGEISLKAADGGQKVIKANGESVRAPIANLRPRVFQVAALSEVKGIRIPDLVLSAAGCSGRIAEHNVITVESQEDDERREIESRLSFQLYQDLMNDEAILPSLPDLALKIRRAIDDDISDAKIIARLVETDPAMAAKVLKAANSAMYGGMNGVETCSAAVVRLGMQTTRQLVLAFALKDVFQSDDPVIRKRMQALWKHSAHIAALCFVLARRTRRMPAEEALLIGLVHDVGAIAILNYAKKFPELVADEVRLDEIISRMRGELGAMILRKWNFTPAVVVSAREAENWLRANSAEIDFSDLLISAQVLERLSKNELRGLPPFGHITAVKRVLGDDASPRQSLEILLEAKAQIDEMYGALRG